MPALSRVDSGLLWRHADEHLLVQQWGTDSLRVRASIGPVRDDLLGALSDTEPAANQVDVEITDDGATITHGGIRASVDLARGLLTFTRSGTGEVLLVESPAHFAWPGARRFAPQPGGSAYRLEQRFAAHPEEKIFGLGQHMHGMFDQKHASIELVQRNAEVSIPFAVSSRGYGFLWNNPAVGNVEFAATGTRWVADSARQIDYWVTTGAGPAEILSHYADATGHSPVLPDWAGGYWQSKLRYSTQEELLEVAREHRRRDLPLSVIVCDYFHWTHLGDWRFDESEWPDPRAMVEELAGMGVRLLVSVWPSVNPFSSTYDTMREQGFLIRTESGTSTHHLFPDKGFGDRFLGISFYDATDPAARAFVWDRVKEGYFDLGIRTWWLDAAEPEIFPEEFANLRFTAGPGTEVANAYPREHARGFFEGMQREGEDEVVLLIRSAWAGSQRYGSLLWSGDIRPTWESLRQQLTAGLNVAMSGLPWWTTDIGGFHGGDPTDPGYRELYVRWFQWAVFCPVLRAHGHREPRGGEFHAGHSGGPNEIWSYGEEVYPVLRDQLQLRERLRPYLHRQMTLAAETGVPVMRPVFVDFPDDPKAWTLQNEYLFGADLLVAPVTTPGAREREVYLPAGARWTHTLTGIVHDGGATVLVPAPLEGIPVFLRDGADVPITA